MRALLSIVAGVALAVAGTVAVAGSGYTPPASSGGGVEGDGTGVTDASAFRSALSLGTAATANTGTSMGNVVALGMGAALPAVNASNLTGISSTQVSGLGTAAGYSATSFLQAANNLSDVTPITARSNLGLGTAATLDTGTGAGNVLVLDGSGAIPATVTTALTNTWDIDYVASRDGRANTAGWTESGGTHAIATSGGINHHEITGSTSVASYITRSFSITTNTTSWEVQIEWQPTSADGQASITVYDGTRRVWIYAAAAGWRDNTGAGAAISDLDPLSNWNTLTIRRVGDIIELWEGPRRVNLYLYSAMTASGTAASVLVGDQLADTTARTNKIRSIKARSSGSYNSLPSELFRNTARGR